MRVAVLGGPPALDLGYLGLVLKRHRILNLVILVTSSSSSVLVVWSELIQPTTKGEFTFYQDH